MKPTVLWKEKTAAEHLQIAREALKQAIQEARVAYEEAVDTTNPFHVLEFSVQNICFQLILHWLYRLTSISW